MNQETVTRLLDVEAIQRLKSRYCRFVDSKQWAALSGLFTEDAKFDGFASAPNGSDAAAFVRGVSNRLADAITMHHCHTPDIDFLDDAHASGLWAMADYMEWPHPINFPGFPKARGMYGFGHYEEDYCKVAGVWRMCHLRLLRTRLIPLPDDHPKSATPPVFPARRPPVS